MRDASLLFDWPGRHHIYVVLPFAIVLATALHAGIFYLFSIVYPHSQTEGPEPAHVYFVPEGKKNDARLAVFLHTADPALFAPGRGLTRKEVAKSALYTPQYDAQGVILDAMPTLRQTASDAPKIYGPVASSALRQRMPQTSPARTRLAADGALRQRLPALPETVSFVTPSMQSLEPTVFLIAVHSDGSVLHILPQHQGSGNAALDEAALKLLRSLKFAPADANEEWGFVSFQWGSDVRFVEAP